MHPLRFSRALLSLTLVTAVVSSFVLDWRENHLLNPLWHPHARFHGGLLLFFLAGTSAIALWNLWRRSAEPQMAVLLGAGLSLAYWTPLFYTSLVVPGATVWAGIPGHEPRVFGHVFYPNLAVAGVFIVVSLVPLWLSRRRQITP